MTSAGNFFRPSDWSETARNLTNLSTVRFLDLGTESAPALFFKEWGGLLGIDTEWARVFANSLIIRIWHLDLLPTNVREEILGSPANLLPYASRVLETLRKLPGVNLYYTDCPHIVWAGSRDLLPIGESYQFFATKIKTGIPLLTFLLWTIAGPEIEKTNSVISEWSGIPETELPRATKNALELVRELMREIE